MSVTVTEETNRVDVSASVIEVTVQAAPVPVVTITEQATQVVVAQETAPSVTVTEQPVTVTVTQAPTPTVEVASAGVQGIQGPAGPAGDASGMGFVHHQSAPATTVQINHGFLFQPAGIVCMSTGDAIPLLGVGVSYPMAGFIELSFGVPFTGDVFLS